MLFKQMRPKPHSIWGNVTQAKLLKPIFLMHFCVNNNEDSDDDHPLVDARGGIVGRVGARHANSHAHRHGELSLSHNQQEHLSRFRTVGCT